jgi:hypothetical protein
MNNRRNLYRILHVQPEAPIEIIKASYRSLMTKIKVHPDLGGNHESAVLINQAYAVLGDLNKRSKYDEMLQSRKSQGRGHPVHEAPIDKHKSARPHKSSSYKAVWDDDRSPSSAAPQRCLFCGTDLAFAPRANKYCIHCASPLTSAHTMPNDRLRELFGRRASLRIAKAGTLVIYPSWPHEGYSARLSDLSLSGICMLTEYNAHVGQILKFNSDNLKGIARVVSVQVNSANFWVHASFLTTDFVTKAGIFVSEKV